MMLLVGEGFAVHVCNCMYVFVRACVVLDIYGEFQTEKNLYSLYINLKAREGFVETVLYDWSILILFLFFFFANRVRQNA